MQSNTKATPKSCSCTQCRRANAKALGLVTKQERAFRHSQNQALRKGVLEAFPAGMRQRNG